MVENIHEPVSVKTTYNSESGRAQPELVRWSGRVYRVVSVGYHYRDRRGRAVHHVFSVSVAPPEAEDATLAMSLRLDTETLAWTLERVADGAGD